MSRETGGETEDDDRRSDSGPEWVADGRKEDDQHDRDQESHRCERVTRHSPRPCPGRKHVDDGDHQGEKCDRDDHEVGEDLLK